MSDQPEYLSELPLADRFLAWSNAAIARIEELVAEVQANRTALAAIDALCARQGVTVDGIVRLVDKLFSEGDPFKWYLTMDGYSESGVTILRVLRRLAQEEHPDE